MMYKNIECPHCGNEIIAKGIKEPQKCKWCRRLISIKIKKTRGKKFVWEAIPIDFEQHSE